MAMANGSGRSLRPMEMGPALLAYLSFQKPENAPKRIFRLDAKMRQV